MEASGWIGTSVAVVAAGVLAASPLYAQPTPQSQRAWGQPAGLDLYLPIPSDNPLRAEVIDLGRTLFFDPILSRDSSIACGSCHQPANGFTSPRRVSVGVLKREGTRNVPAIINRGYGRAFFWDGRIRDLEQQVLQPILAENEMDATLDEVTHRLASHPGYSSRFRTVFERTVNRDDLARALASYVRSIQAGGSRFDRLVAGDTMALTPLEREGLRLFQGKARCDMCHVGTNLTDEAFHNTGVAWRNDSLVDDGRHAVTGSDLDRGAFKTPTLREVERTAPYMHDGSLATLEEVVAFYSRGGNANPYQDERIRRIDLTPREQQALVAFLRTFTGTIVEGRSPSP